MIWERTRRRTFACESYKSRDTDTSRVEKQTTDDQVVLKPSSSCTTVMAESGRSTSDAITTHNA